MTAADPKIVRTIVSYELSSNFLRNAGRGRKRSAEDTSGDKDNPDSRGFLCVRGRSTSEIFGNRKRLLYPQIRDDRGTDAWRRVSWDEALDFMAKRMRAVP